MHCTAQSRRRRAKEGEDSNTEEEDSNNLLEDNEIKAVLLFADITVAQFRAGEKAAIISKIAGKVGISALLKAACTKHGVSISAPALLADMP